MLKFWFSKANIFNIAPVSLHFEKIIIPPVLSIFQKHVFTTEEIVRFCMTGKHIGPKNPPNLNRFLGPFFAYFWGKTCVVYLEGRRARRVSRVWISLSVCHLSRIAVVPAMSSTTLRSCKDRETSICMTLLLRGLCVVCTFEKQKRLAALELEKSHRLLLWLLFAIQRLQAHLLNCCGFECITGA